MIAYKFRIYPSKQQSYLLMRYLDLCRFTYNKLLEKLKESQTTDRGAIQHSIVELKEIFPELKMVHSKTLQYECYKLFSNLKSLSQLKKKGHKVGALRFKGKDRFKTIHYNQSGFKLEQKTMRTGILYLSKVGGIYIRSHRVTEGKIKQITIKKSASKWYAILVTDAEYRKQKGIGAIGLDLGVINYFADSEGNTVESPLFLKRSLSKIQSVDRVLSRKEKGSQRRWKMKQRLASLYEKVSNQRNDFLHKVTTKIIKENDTVYVEDLNINKLVKGSKLNVRNFLDCSWGKFVQMLEHKAESAGAQVIRVNPRNTSKKCSECGAIHQMPLNMRFYACECGLKLDRDINAAKNVLAQGLGLANGLKKIY